MAQSLSGELAEGQRKLIALATAGANASSMNPLVTQLSNGPLGALHEKVYSFYFSSLYFTYWPGLMYSQRMH